MATIKLTSEGRDGTIRFLGNPTIDFNRYFHKADTEVVMNQEGQPESIGGQILSAFVDVQKDLGLPTEIVKQEEILVWVSVVEVDELGNPTRILNETGDTIAASCRPFQEHGIKLELRKL